ncbi:hypothetical protein B5P19_11510 [Clavibacter sepedonicus]|nr:hypothetical protein B5P19_11510 [Clavibacter sepedonicus]OQJ54351.1 hypothetical protein B5P20_09695 [Clavibacter sepedonicus]
MINPAGASASDRGTVANVIRSASPEFMTTVADRSNEAPGETNFALNAWGVTARVPQDANKEVRIGAPGKAAIGVSLPSASSARLVASGSSAVTAFDNGDGSTSAVLPQEDGAVQFATIISDSQAPDEYTYSLDIPAKSHLAFNGESGSVSILDSHGLWIAGVAAPWAKDATGASVPTHFKISGDQLTQVVQHEGEGVKYPVVADPWLGVSLIDSVVWTAGDEWGPTAQIYPTSAGRDTIFAPKIANEAAWGEALEKTDRSRLDHNNLHDQFTCHWQVVRYDDPGKSSWNLDSARPDVGLAETIAARCNPGGGSED